MNKIKKFYREHREASIVIVGAVAYTAGIVTVSHIVKNGMQIKHADFEPYNSAVDNAAILRVRHRNGKTTDIFFETKK